MTDWHEAFDECVREHRRYSVINHPLIPRGELWVVAGRHCRGTI